MNLQQISSTTEGAVVTPQSVTPPPSPQISGTTGGAVVWPLATTNTEPLKPFGTPLRA